MVKEFSGTRNPNHPIEKKNGSELEKAKTSAFLEKHARRVLDSRRWFLALLASWLLTLPVGVQLGMIPMISSSQLIYASGTTPFG